ncbi:MAG: hypothetical protein WC878_03650 [Candidatus Paceibacterota bacterium]|jgi:hypothetical protein
MKNTYIIAVSVFVLLGIGIGGYYFAKSKRAVLLFVQKEQNEELIATTTIATTTVVANDNQDEESEMARELFLLPAEIIINQPDAEVFLNDLKIGMNQIHNLTVKMIQATSSQYDEESNFIFYGKTYSLHVDMTAAASGGSRYRLYTVNKQGEESVKMRSGYEGCIGTAPILFEFNKVLYMIDATAGRSGYTSINICALQAGIVIPLLSVPGSADWFEYGVGQGVFSDKQVSLVEKNKQLYLKIYNNNQHPTKFGKTDLYYLFE